VPTFDGVPLDADVTLPAGGSGPFPLIVMLHGYGGSKTDFEKPTPEGDGKNTYHYNTNYYAKQGYAVLTYTARGFGHSCGGGPAADHTGACANGYIRLADSRYEARDTQYLVGKLVDAGIADPAHIGVTGISYGGGQSMELAFLKDRIRLPDGAYQAWKSANNTPLSITAAWPRWPWSDLASALLPNGRFLDFDNSTAGLSRNPVGVPIQSYVNGLYLLGLTNGYYCPTPCSDPGSDISGSFTRVLAGEPASADTVSRLNEITADKGAYGLAAANPTVTPSPLLLQNGWTDDLFPPAESLRIYNLLRGRNPAADVSLQFGDLGHSRGSNKPTVNTAFNDDGAAFFAKHLMDTGTAPAAGSVKAFTQTCPKTADTPDGGPFTAASWPAIHPGQVQFGGAAAQAISSEADQDAGPPFDPITQTDPQGTSDSCRTVDSATTGGSGTATYEHTVNTPFTLLGLPTVRATIKTTGQYGQLDSRLYDVLPDGTERLITRGTYRLLDNQAGTVTFQLHGNGYRFLTGHKVKLELRGNDAPYLRKSNGTFSVTVSNLSVSLPTVEKLSIGVPSGPPPKKACGALRIRVGVSPSRVGINQRRHYLTVVSGRRPCEPKGHRISGALISFAGRHMHTDVHGRAVFVLVLHESGQYRVAGHVTGHRTVSAFVTVVPRRHR
jgi:fermentation-respiration switch protein FrsA (DUF1100 family)